MSLPEDYPPPTTIQNIHDENPTSKACTKILATTNHTNEKVNVNC